MKTVASTTCSYKDSPRNRRVTWNALTIHYFEEPGRKSEITAIPAKTKKEKELDSMDFDLSDIFDENSGVELRGVRRRRKSVILDYESLENTPKNLDVYQLGIYAGGIPTRKTQSLDEIPSYTLAARLLATQQSQSQASLSIQYDSQRVSSQISCPLYQSLNKFLTPVVSVWRSIIDKLTLTCKVVVAEVVDLFKAFKAYKLRLMCEKEKSSIILSQQLVEEEGNQEVGELFPPRTRGEHLSDLYITQTYSLNLFRKKKGRRVKQAINLIRIYSESVQAKNRQGQSKYPGHEWIKGYSYRRLKAYAWTSSPSGTCSRRNSVNRQTKSGLNSSNAETLASKHTKTRFMQGSRGSSLS